MKLLTSTVLTLRVLMGLSVSASKHISTDVIARDLSVSRNHLYKIVQYLAEAGLVCTIRGPRGGVMLAQSANDIRVGDVVRDRERDHTLVECFCPDSGACALLPRCSLRVITADAKDVFYEYLGRFTLADCLAGPASSAQARNNRREKPR